MTACPECGGVLALVRDGLVGELMLPGQFVRGVRELYWRASPRPFIACTECEFCRVLVPGERMEA